MEINTLFQTKTAKKPYPLAPHTYIAYIRESPPSRGTKNALQIMSLAAYVSETNKVNLSLTFIQRLGY